MSLQDLTNEVNDQRTVIASAKTLLEGLHQRLDDAIKAQDPAALDKLAADLKSNTDALALAVQQNTPQAPTPTTMPPSDSTPSTPPSSTP